MQFDSKKKPAPVIYCCAAKHFHSNDASSVGNALKISPRAVILKRGLKINRIYTSIINITNKGLYKRYLVYTTDCCDTEIKIFPPNLANNFLLPEQSVQVIVNIEPKLQSEINRRRHVFITSQHPSITYAVPIIIPLLSEGDNKNSTVSMPCCITFPPAAVGNFTYYEMIAYNKSIKPLHFNIKCPLSDLSVHVKSLSILKQDLGVIVLKLYCRTSKNTEDSLRFKFSSGENLEIPFHHEPLKFSLFVDNIVINFDRVRFNRKETKELSICNESDKEIIFHVNFTLPKVNEIIRHSDEVKNKDVFSYKHFDFEPCCGTINVNSTFNVKITFQPIKHDNLLLSDDDVEPFSIVSILQVSWENGMKTEKRNIILQGQILGPEIEISPAVLDLRNIYFGEEQCTEIYVTNKDEICNAHVDLRGLSDWHIARIVAQPKEGLTLKPKESDMFQLQLYSTVIGKFLFKLEFKVKDGGMYSMVVRGFSKNVQVKCFPDIISLDVIPIAMPQKRLVLLMNPLTVPITVQCTTKDDGSETPLVLNTHNVKEHLPITVKDPFIFMQQIKEQERELENFQIQEEEFELRYSDDVSEQQSLLSVHSLIEENLQCSEFENLVDEIPNLSHNLVSVLKDIKILDKSEMEKKIVEEALNTLLKTPYFLNMDKYKNYTQMDWNSLATDPKEIYCNTEIIHLKPNTGKAISVVVIPNVLGSHRKYIELRVCPLMAAACKERADISQIVDSEFMTSKLWVEYNCSVPEIIYDNVVIMDDQLYAGEYYNFEMGFQNISKFGGFFYFNVLPQSSSGFMRFPHNTWKYFIEPVSKINVQCQVKFTKIGFVALHGQIKFLGVYATFPFHIKAYVLPPKVNILPRCLSKSLQVLEYAKLHIFIENATPSITWFKLKLKDETFMDIEPEGAQLDPKGQTMYVTISAFFPDPGTYKNVLHVIMEFDTIEKVPITINVKGIPLFFEPEIRAKHFNFGYIVCNTEEEFYEEKPNFSKVIKVINKGLRSYRLTITRTKGSAKPSCTHSSSKAKLSIKPNNLIIPGQTETSFSLFISCCEPISVFSEYRLQISDQHDINHIESSRITTLATFIMPELSWSKREVIMSYCRTHKHKEHEQWETIKLANISQINLECINLKISGPFKMKQLFEHNYENELNFPMAALEKKEFFIMLNKNEIKTTSKCFYEGSITCSANLRAQQSVRLKVLVFVPKLTLKEKEVTMFVKNVEGGTYIELTNYEEIPATYKWIKLKEELRYLSDEDDVKQVASIILSDIIRIVDLQTMHPDLDSETNLTRRYQKYKCVLKELDDPILAKEIICEIINNLDLSVKRYKLCNDIAPPQTDDYLKEETELNEYSAGEEQSLLQEEATNEEISDFSQHYAENLNNNDEIELASSQQTVATQKSSKKEDCVYYTLDDIMGHLKLEDSYEALSLASSEHCELKKSVYFYEKTGHLKDKQRVMCALHIPAIRRGHELQATFQLDVVGGESQQFEITFVNLDNTISIDKQHVYLGFKPWYERYQTKSLIANTTNYELLLKVNHIPRKIENNLTKIALGYNNILGGKMLHLSPYQNIVLRTEGIMGFSEDFKRELCININESDEKTLKIFGHGAMPMLMTTIPRLPLADQHSDEIVEDYLLLQKVYYFEIFKTITEKDDSFKYGMQAEENGEQDGESVVTVSTLLLTDDENSSATSHSSLDMKREQQFVRLMLTYVLVNNNEDLPNYEVLEQLLQTERFLNHLNYNPEISSLLNLLYQNYLLHSKSSDDKTPFNIKHFNVQCLPFQLRTSILHMGRLYLNQYCKFFITLEFIGPGVLIAAARTAIKIPGLMIDFKILNKNKNSEFSYSHVEHKTLPCDKFYRNINERLLDKETSPKVKHAHSYDFSTQGQHQRIVSINDVKCVKNYYNSLNKSIYVQQKYHFTHCKISANSKITSPGTKIGVCVLFRPEKNNYKHNQKLEDYIYIDLHMGPTLPILMEALIVDRNRINNR